MSAPFFAASTLPPAFALLALMLVAVVVVSLALLHLRQSLLVAYFLCGLLIANTGLLDLLGESGIQQSLQPMSELGVMLLLFTLGMEFSLGELRYLHRMAFLGGGWQMGASLLLAIGAGWLLLPLAGSHLLVFGVACALSSTAISVKVFQDMGMSASPGARFALAIAIFQDLFVIAFLVVLPVLLPASGAVESGVGTRFGIVIGKGILFVALAWALAKWVIPNLLHAVTRTRSRELFTLTVAGLCMGVAMLAAVLQLSLVLGAFVAGLAVSESIYKHRILADVQPVKDLFLTLFFVSVGLMIDLPAALRHWEAILLTAVLLLAGKGLLIWSIARRFHLRSKPAVFAALGLASAGEFSLLLVQKVEELSPWPDQANQILLASMALSMASVPLLMRLAEPLGNWLERRFRQPHDTPAALPPARRVKALQDHAIVCGYGPVGQALVESLAREGVASVVIELNAETVRSLAKAGQPVLFADAQHEETWQIAGVERCRLVAFTFPNVDATAAALPLVRRIKPEVPILARTKFASEADRLRTLGVTTVIFDELESGRALVREALCVFDNPREAG